MIRFAIAISMLSGLGVLSACTPPLTEDNAAELMADAVCRKERKCRPESFDDRYDDLPDCADDYEDGYDAVINGLAIIGLELDIDEARSCHADLRAATCETYIDGSFSNDCDDLFSF